MANPNVASIGEYLAHKTGVAPSLQSAGALNGTGIDRTGYNSAVLVAQSGALAGGPTTQTLDCKVQHSSDNSTWADYVPPTQTTVAAITQITAASTLAKFNVNLSGAKQYIRAVQTAGFTGGASPTIASASWFVLGGAVSKPTP